MENKTYKKVIENYIEAYNNHNIDEMLSEMDDNIIFTNISGGKINLQTRGITELRSAAITALEFFRERSQTITNMKFEDDKVEINIVFRAVTAVDFPDGLKAGNAVELQGTSVFKFRNNKITELTDISG
jgi:hypothetical protein